MRRFVIMFCFAGLVASLVGCGVFDKFGGGKAPKQAAPNPVPKISKSVDTRRNWSHNIGAITEHGHVSLIPVVHGETIFTAAAGGTVSAVDAAGGRVRWRTKLNGIISGGVGFGEDKVFVGTPQGKLIAVAASDGEFVWEQQLESEILAAPTAGAGITVARTVDGRVYGLSSETGENKWSFKRDVPSLSLRGNGAPLLDRGVVIAGFASGKVVAAGAADGKVLWDVSVGEPRGRNEVERIVDIDAKPILFGSVLYVSSFQGRVAALALGSQRILWTQDVSSYTGLTADQDRLYISDDGGQVVSLNRLSGEILWTQDTFLRRTLSGPAVTENYVVIGDHEGFLHVLKKEDGEVIGQLQIGGGGIRITPIVHNNTVYVTTQGGRLVSISLVAIN